MILAAALLVATVVAAALSDATGVVLGLTLAAGALSVGAGAWIMWQTAGVFHAIDQVTEAMGAVIDGEVGAQLAEQPAGETARLIQAFNGMSRRMRESSEEAEASQREFRQAVRRLGDTLAATHDLSRILQFSLETARLLLRAERALFFSVNPARTRLEVRAALGGEEGVLLAPGSGLAGAVIARSRPLLYPGDAAPVPPEPMCSSAIAVPFFSQGMVFGVVALYGRVDGGEFASDHFETLEALVRQAETAVDNVFLHEEAQRLSITDGLTGLWNRRQFDLRVRQELERAARFNRSVGLILCDLDHFKDLNDSCGHLGGDAALVEVAKQLAAATREIDTVARYGGEEFVMVLPETDLQGTLTLAQKARRAIAEAPLEWDGTPHSVTASFGVATYPDMGTSAQELLTAADAALYRAKRLGRNRVEVAGRVPAGSVEIDVSSSAPEVRRTQD